MDRLIERVPVPALLVDSEAGIVGWNAGATALLGWSASQVMGDASGEVAAALADVLAAASSGEPTTAVARAADGSSFPVEVTAWATGTADAPTAAFVRDLRDEHRIREELQRANLRLEMFEAVTDEAILVLEDGLVVDANDGAARLFGCDVEDLVGRAAEELVVDADRERLRVRLQTGDGSQAEFRVRRSDGSTADVIGRSRERDVGGVRQRVTTARDVTDLRRMQFDVQAVIDTIPAMLAYWDDTLHNRMANRAHVDWFGKTPADLLGLHLSEMVDEGTWNDYIALVEQALAGRTMSFDSELRDAAGTIRQVNVSYIPDIVEGHVRGFTVHVVDITDRKRDEQELARALEDARRANHDLEVFAYLASHDLKEPLRMVVSFSDKLESRLGGALDERARAYLDFVRDGATRMTELVDGLLGYSRAGRAAVGARSVDLGEEIRAVLHTLGERIAETRGQVAVDDQLPAVHADPLLLRQVLQNLIDNSLKFVAAGVEPHVRIGAACLEDVVRITVADNGIGIPGDLRERAFQVFQRLNPREVYEATGIGLAIVQRLIEAQDGAIVIEDAPGPGSTFVVTLPAGAPAVGAHAEASP